jgi:hypothetical protein
MDETKHKKFLLARSKMGSSYHVPNDDPRVPANSPSNGLEIPWNRWVIIAPMWKDNTYLLAAVEMDRIELVESDKPPEPPLEIPTDLSAEHQEFLRVVLFGKYTSEIKQLLTDWRSENLMKDDKQGRAGNLVANVLPVVTAWLELEPKSQNREEVIADLKAVEAFALKYSSFAPFK